MSIHWIVDGVWVILNAFSLREQFELEGMGGGEYTDYLIQQAAEGLFGVCLGFVVMLYSSAFGKLVARGIPEKQNIGINADTIIHAGTVLIGMWLIASALPELLVHGYYELRAVDGYAYSARSIPGLAAHLIVGAILILFDAWLIKPFRWLRYGPNKPENLNTDFH